jgi:proteasome lid subunit RPN8/RPN11
MFTASHHFILTITDEAGSVLHSEEMNDFLPCVEEIYFAAVCAGQVANDGKPASALIEPVWSNADKETLAGVRASLPPLSKTWGLEIFADKVTQALRNGDKLREWLEEKKKFAWQVTAEPRAEEKTRRFTSRLSRAPYPLERRPLADFGIVQSEARAFSVFIASALLDELRRATADSLEIERADFLLGHLLQPGEGSVALVITDRLPAVVETSASKAHFSFSPQTFVEAQREMAGRSDGAVICGWHHNHPPPCGGECLPVVPPCKTATLFFSLDDRLVHRASFAASWMIALVSGKEAERRADQPGVRAWGWRDGIVQQTDFTIFG